MKGPGKADKHLGKGGKKTGPGKAPATSTDFKKPGKPGKKGDCK